MALASLWLGASAVGVTLFFRYENRPGIDPAAPDYWPAESTLVAPTNEPSLVMFIHPQCPCSRASLGELAHLVGDSDSRVKATVLVLDGNEEGSAIEASPGSTWRQAFAIPGVIVRADRGGEEARKFGSATSGRVLLYGADRRLLFAGGITSSRGHAGANTGREMVQALIKGDVPRLAGTPVFGCPLFAPRPTPSDFQP